MQESLTLRAVHPSASSSGITPNARGRSPDTQRGGTRCGGNNGVTLTVCGSPARDRLRFPSRCGRSSTCTRFNNYGPLLSLGWLSEAKGPC